MAPLDRLMNRVADMTHSNSIFKQHVLSRATVMAGCLPLEAIAVAQNLIKLPFEAVLMTIKVPVKIVNACLHSANLKNFEERLPGPLQLIKTAFKVIGFAIGALFTGTLGILSPYRNFRLHTALDLVSDEKAAAELLKREQEAARQQELQREVMLLHIKNLILAQRLKVAEQERANAQQALQKAEEEAKPKIIEEPVQKIEPIAAKTPPKVVEPVAASPAKAVC